ncbi:MAG: response regulator [Sandaracinaceae bacterium]
MSILLVEDNPGDRVLVSHWLRLAVPQHQLTEFGRASEAVQHLEHNPVDLVLLDITLPDASGVEGVLAVRGATSATPLIVLTGRADEALAQECVRLGAHDYLEKSHTDAMQLRRSILLAQARFGEHNARKELQHAERLNTVGQLAASVAHEINNPLQYVSANLSSAIADLDEIASQLPEPDALSGFSKALVDARVGAARIAAVVRTMNQFSRVETGSYVPVDLREVARDASDMVGHHVRRSARLEMALEPVAYVEGSRGPLLQVVVNLLVNAAQAVSETGRTGTVRVQTLEDADGVALVVSDDGCGMSDATRARVFDAFFTSKPDGVGLGLSVCRDIVEDHGGSLEAESTLGEGARFRMRLPRAVSPRSLRPVSSVADGLSPLTVTRLRVLLVDDEPLVLRSLRRLLRMHDVSSAVDGLEALERLKEGEAFDVVVCDLSMPGLGGRELHRRVQKSRPELVDRFVFLTGGVLGEADRDFHQAHAPRTLHKPVQAEQLLAMIQRLASHAND